MPDKPTFVVNDRRKFTNEGELRHDLPAETPADTSLTGTATPSEAPRGPQLVTEPLVPAAVEAELADLPESEAVGDLYPDEVPLSSQTATLDAYPEDAMPSGPTAEQSQEAARAYNATVDRLETAMRAANPGGERIPPMDFQRFVQSLYTQALILLGGGAQPGETPRVDILGARETIDMLSVLAEKSKNNLTPNEDQLLESALFDLRMGFLEITQALARQAAQRQPGGLAPGMPPSGAGPRIVR